MGTHDVKIHGIQVKATFIDNEEAAEIEIAELRKSLQMPIVGILVVFCHGPKKKFDVGWVILCAGTSCLIIQLHRMSSFPKSLRDFLSDDSICFVCGSASLPAFTIPVVGTMYTRLLSCMKRVELGYLGARVLENPSLNKPYVFYELAEQVGLSLSSPIYFVTSRCKDTVFTDEDIQDLISQPYTCYIIGDRLLSMLDS